MPTINPLRTVPLLWPARLWPPLKPVHLLGVPTRAQPKLHVPLSSFSESHALTRWANPRKAGTCPKAELRETLGELHAH